MKHATERELLHWALQGDEQAVAFLETLGRISQVWDDLVDRDRPVAPEAITGAFRRCLIDLPLNPFFAAFREHLVGALDMVILDWMTANALERDPANTESDTALAYVLRDQLAGLIVLCARLLHGDAWALKVAVAVRRHIHDETIEDYRKELRA